MERKRITSKKPYRRKIYRRQKYKQRLIKRLELEFRMDLETLFSKTAIDPELLTLVINNMR